MKPARAADLLVVNSSGDDADAVISNTRKGEVYSAICNDNMHMSWHES